MIKATLFVVFVTAALGNQYIFLISSSFSDKETEAQNGQIFGDLSRPLLYWLGTYSEASAVAVVSSPPSPQPSASGSTGAELLAWLLSLTAGTAYLHPWPCHTLKQKPQEASLGLFLAPPEIRL